MPSPEFLYHIKSCEQLTSFFGVFYRPLPPLWQIFHEHEWLHQNYPSDQLTLHISFQKSDVNHYRLVENFLRFGKLGTKHRTSLTNTFYPVSSYLHNIYDRHHHDLILVMLTQPDDVVWEHTDLYGVRDGFPNLPFPQNQPLPPGFKTNPDLTYIPPDRIIGFYYLPPHLHQC